MKYAFVVFDISIGANSEFGWEFVGVFATEKEADDACISGTHLMACVTVGVAQQSPACDLWEFGYKYPRYDEKSELYYGANAYRLPPDLENQ